MLGKQLGQCGGISDPGGLAGSRKNICVSIPTDLYFAHRARHERANLTRNVAVESSRGAETLGVGNGAVAPVVGGPSLHSAEAVASCHPTALRNPLDSNLDMTPFFDCRQSCENLRGWHRYPKGSDTGNSLAIV
jgi:hypothetical protein